MSTEIKNEKTFAIVLGIIMVIAIIAAFAAGIAYGEKKGFNAGVQKGMEDSSLLQFEVTNFADYQPVSVGFAKVHLDQTTILYDVNTPAYLKKNITMFGIKVHRYPQELLDQENAKKIAEAAEET